MPGFRFPLERVLLWRRAGFAAEQARLGPLETEQQRLEAARDEILRASDRARRELLATGAVDGSDLAALSGYRTRLERERVANEHQGAEARQRIAAQRERVMEAHRRVRLLEKLRGRRLEEWRVVSNREMETFASEAFLARWRGPRRRGASTAILMGSSVSADQEPRRPRMPVNVLIVDDSAAIRKLLQRVLAQANLGVGKMFEAADGREALDAVKHQPVGLILCDIDMPNMDGLQLLTELRSKDPWKHIPVLMISAEGSHNKVLEAVQLGAQGFVRKPFTTDQIREKLAGVL